MTTRSTPCSRSRVAVECRMSEVVEADAAETGLAEEHGESAGEVGRVDRTALRRGEHVPVLTPRGACCLTLALLLFVVLL